MYFSPKYSNCLCCDKEERNIRKYFLKSHTHKENPYFAISFKYAVQVRLSYSQYEYLKLWSVGYAAEPLAVIAEHCTEV